MWTISIYIPSRFYANAKQVKVRPCAAHKLVTVNKTRWKQCRRTAEELVVNTAYLCCTTYTWPLSGLSTFCAIFHSEISRFVLYSALAMNIVFLPHWCTTIVSCGPTSPVDAPVVLVYCDTCVLRHKVSESSRPSSVKASMKRSSMARNIHNIQLLYGDLSCAV